MAASQTGPCAAKPITIGGMTFPSTVEAAKHYGEHRRSLQRAIWEGRTESFIVGRLLRMYQHNGNESALAEAKRIVDHMAGEQK